MDKSSTTQELIDKEWNQQEVQLADKDRCKQIVRGEIGLLEFIELTGIGAGRYGSYQIDEKGVSVPATEVISDSHPSIQHDLLRVRARCSLSFPCSVMEFTDWYKGTHSLNGISDFPLAKACAAIMDISSTIDRPRVTKAEIISAFCMNIDSRKNEQWWDERMRDAKRYAGLVECRAQPGRGKHTASLWYPDIVAGWLIQNGHMTQQKVLKVMQERFPDIETDLL